MTHRQPSLVHLNSSIVHILWDITHSRTHLLSSHHPCHLLTATFQNVPNMNQNLLSNCQIQELFLSATFQVIFYNCPSSISTILSVALPVNLCVTFFVCSTCFLFQYNFQPVTVTHHRGRSCAFSEVVLLFFLLVPVSNFRFFRFLLNQKTDIMSDMAWISLVPHHL